MPERFRPFPARTTLRGGCYVENLTKGEAKRLAASGLIRRDGSFLILTSAGRDALRRAEGETPTPALGE